MTYKQKAEILIKFFGIYGQGNFDLSLEEIAYILELLETKKTESYLEVNLLEFYERLSKTRLG